MIGYTLPSNTMGIQVFGWVSRLFIACGCALMSSALAWCKRTFYVIYDVCSYCWNILLRYFEHCATWAECYWDWAMDMHIKYFRMHAISVWETVVLFCGCWFRHCPGTSVLDWLSLHGVTLFSFAFYVTRVELDCAVYCLKMSFFEQCMFRFALFLALCIHFIM